MAKSGRPGSIQRLLAAPVGMKHARGAQVVEAAFGVVPQHLREGTATADRFGDRIPKEGQGEAIAVEPTPSDRQLLPGLLDEGLVRSETPLPRISSSSPAAE